MEKVVRKFTLRSIVFSQFAKFPLSPKWLSVCLNERMTASGGFCTTPDMIRPLAKDEWTDGRTDPYAISALLRKQNNESFITNNNLLMLHSDDSRLSIAVPAKAATMLEPLHNRRKKGQSNIQQVLGWELHIVASESAFDCILQLWLVSS